MSETPSTPTTSTQPTTEKPPTSRPRIQYSREFLLQFRNTPCDPALSARLHEFVLRMTEEDAILKHRTSSKHTKSPFTKTPKKVWHPKQTRPISPQTNAIPPSKPLPGEVPAKPKRAPLGVIKSKKDSKHNKEHQGASTSAVIILSGKEPGKNMKPHETTDKENVVNSQPSHAPTLELKPKQVKVLPTPDTCTPPSKTQRTNTATEDASSPQSEQHRLEQRQKQIDYGYQTEGYKCYIQQVPKHQRTRGMPKTPEKKPEM